MKTRLKKLTYWIGRAEWDAFLAKALQANPRLDKEHIKVAVLLEGMESLTKPAPEGFYPPEPKNNLIAFIRPARTS